MASTAAGEAAKANLRVFFIPAFASGHMIPMADLACLFSARPGVEATMVVTPANVDVIRPILHRSAVRLLLYPFPSAEVGLPAGLENLATVPSADEWRVYKAIDLVQDAHRQILHHHGPDAVVADVPFWWTTAIAGELGIPRVTFHAVGVFPQCVMNSLHHHRPHELVAGESDPFTVPGLPDPPVELVRSELPAFLRREDHLTQLWDRIKKAQLESFGVVVNTFYELEPGFCDHYRRTDCRRAWFVGPVAGDGGEAAERGGGGEENRVRCMGWLDKQKPGSVVFACFGSWCHFSPEQLKELAGGLEASGHPYIWVVREGGEVTGEVTERGLVVRGWVPQVAILNHPAVGAFMTHCGWNSVLEAAAAGVPMLTWPLVFEQFINERLVVGVMGVGARVWDGFRSTDEAAKVVVPGAAVAREVADFMEGGGEARRRAAEYKAAARAATAEGGSSRRDLDGLIDELVAMADERKRVEA